MSCSDIRITISIVLYKNDSEHISLLVQSLKSCTLPIKVFFMDNSPDATLAKFIPDSTDMHYQHQGQNKGYGTTNNVVMESQVEKGDYHLAMNADVYFDKNTLESIVKYMDERPKIGLLLPRVLNPDNSEQPLFKLLPSPKDLIFRRFIPGKFKPFFESDLKPYSMTFAEVTHTFDAPYLSGCFMFKRKKALKEVRLFDTGCFLYCEDIDLTRRIRVKWLSAYYGQTRIYHYFQKGSYKRPKFLYYHIVSAVKHFNKLSWFNDTIRKQINQQTQKAFAAIENTIMTTNVE